MKRSGKTIALVTALAAGVGYAVGVLTAPKSGKETRESIKQSASNSKRQIEEKIKKLHTEVGVLIAKNKEKVAELSGKAKTELKTLVAKAEEAKNKAKDVLSALHEGEADDEDLNIAVKQLKTSIDNLKKFAKKPTQSS